MALQLGDVVPDFEGQTTAGRIQFHNWLGDSWGVLFSHAKNFTPVCKTFPEGWRAPKPYLRIVPQPGVTVKG
jgi:alkyl hydroperoxide reductase subunit AhpC